jgi:hypothetical protein
MCFALHPRRLPETAGRDLADLARRLGNLRLSGCCGPASQAFAMPSISLRPRFVRRLGNLGLTTCSCRYVDLATLVWTFLSIFPQLAV